MLHARVPLRETFRVRLAIKSPAPDQKTLDFNGHRTLTTCWMKKPIRDVEYLVGLV